ncbi:P4 family phage/plasmid primase-like protein [Haloactinopolyspora alba]|uniref:DNA-directed DNA polymerase n=1 Tax=Haloactinopolyspora alba TaxID=648780 RepID=A0A2P8DHI1_9ACTN|nr:phage/plasmid primase, P4 family [Haloactinopolyspora alba]PSK96684.1 P4 family phage/plasmid primase-like protein [Haloactinopolyspora alba]
MTPDQIEALNVARALASAGVPIFVAYPDETEPTGYKLPPRWQDTRPDPAVVEVWRPGMALCAVMGCGLDLVDVDLYKGATLDAIDAKLPTSYGSAVSASGGVHSFVRSMGVRSKNGVLPGLDIKAGAPDGRGRGFAFIAPTVRVSKSTGQPSAYRWVQPPDLARLAQSGHDQSGHDQSGAALARMLAEPAHTDTTGTVEDFMKTGPWQSLTANPEAFFADGRNNGVAKLAAALRGRGGWQSDDAVAVMYARVWPLIDQTAGGHEFTADEFESTIRAAWRQYPDGAEQRAVEAETPPDPEAPQPNPGRYFTEKGRLKPKTLAGDVMYLGPLAKGVDDRVWRYADGVWRPAPDIIRDRATHLLGERYSVTATGAARDIVLANVTEITCDPVEPLINFRNGLLDWRTGTLHPHDPAVPSTVQLPIDYAPDAAAPHFERFLSQVVPADMVELAWELIGYLMYSGNPLHKAVMLTGHGRNGKGTFLRVITALLGRANITNVSLHDLMNTRFATASLFGKLANIAGDIDAGYLENTATFKGITGGDTISAEHKGRDRFDFTPWAVPVFSANKIPASADTTAGYLSRWLVVPFPHSFAGREDRHLGTRLQSPDELAGIAARGIAALPRLLERGDFEETESGSTAMAEFVRRVDQVRTWLHDCTDLDPAHPWVGRTDLYEAYKRWAARDGHKPVKASEFYDRLEAAGAEPAKVRGVRGFRGIRITDQGWAQGAALTAPSLTGDNANQGAEGAGNPNWNSAQESGDIQGAGARPASAPAPAPSPPKDPDVADSATDDSRGADAPAPTLTGENDTQGAEGADTPYPPHARGRVRDEKKRVGAVPAPSAPLINKDSAHSARITATLLGDPPPAESEQPSPKAAARAAAREAAVADAAGADVALPAVVVRDGTTTPIQLTQAAELLATVTTAGQALTVDVETTGFPVGHAEYALRTVQLGTADFAVVLDATDTGQAEAARTALAAAARLHAHSATADLVPLAHAGLIDPGAGWERMHDTVIPAKLADPASTGSDPGLKQLAGAVLDERATAPGADDARTALFKAGKWLTNTKADTPAERSGWAQVNPACATMVRYAASDVLDTAALALELPPVQPGVLERERTAQRMTARVAHHGLRIDGENVEQLHAEHTAARAAAAGRVEAFGVDKPGSGQQLAAKLIELGAELPRTATGRPSVAEGVLEPMRGTAGAVGELVAAVLDYRHHDTALGTFLEPYRQLVQHGDGRARPTVYTLGADTGRMSCVRPNLQQVPREGGFRSCITADPGMMLISADFSSVEIRVAAALSGDPNLRRMLLDEEAALAADPTAKVGLHWEIARQVWGPDATKAHRYVAKRVVFGRIYGGGIRTLAAQAGVPEPVAAAAVDALDSMLPGLAEWSRLTRDAVSNGSTRFQTHSGRTIHLPQRNPHKAPNYCIQGTARELLVDALIKWQDTPWGDRVLLPVHDELVVMVPESDAKSAADALVTCMETEIGGVRIAADPSTPSYAWDDAA